MLSMSRHSNPLLLLSFLLLNGIFRGVQAQSDTENTTTPGHRIIAGFIPKTWPAILGIVLYFASGAIHWIHLVRVGKRHMLTLTIGMTCMGLGFIFRILYSNNPTTLGMYILTTMFVLLSPCAFLATDYILLERLAENLGHEIADRCLFIRSSRVVKFFVWSDVITFFIQSGGGGLQASGNSSMAKTGSNVAIAGLILQLLTFGLFTCLLLVFGFRVRTSYPQSWRVNRHGQSFGSTIGLFKTTDVYDWRILFYILCLSCIAILTRSAFRIVEYAQGFDGFLSVHEGYFYLLDGLPLWLAMTQFCFFWPSRFKPHQGTPLKPSSEQGLYLNNLRV